MTTVSYVNRRMAVNSFVVQRLRLTIVMLFVAAVL